MSTDNTKSQVVNHWGKWVDSNIPVTGVLSHNEVDSWLYESELICLDCDKMMKQEDSENEDNPDYDWIECDSSHTRLLGNWIFDTNTNQYEPDKNGEFAAIEKEMTIQVVWSKYTKRGNLCSPCYPGQVEFSNDGDFIAYTLPDELLYREDG